MLKRMSLFRVAHVLQQLLGSDDEEDYEQLLLEQLTEKEKRMLLK